MRLGMAGVLVALVAACSSGMVETTATALAPTTTAPTTTTAITTTTEAITTTSREPGDICRRGMKWEPGEIYRAGCFLVPVVFDAAGEGWGSLGGGDDWLKVRWRDPEDDGTGVRVALISLASSRAPAEVLDRIAASDRISEVSERTSVVIGGASGLAVDVEGDPEPGGELVSPDGSPCSPDFPVWFPRTYFGHPLLEGAGEDVVGVGACHVARIWVVEVGDRSITIIGGTADPDLHEAALAKIQELFEGMTFDLGGGL